MGALVSPNIKPSALGTLPAVPLILEVGTKVSITERVQNLLHVTQPVEGWILESINGVDTVEYTTKWFLGKHKKTEHVRDPKPQRVVGISYVVPSQLPALPHITIRSEPSELLKSIKPH